MGAVLLLFNLGRPIEERKIVLPSMVNSSGLCDRYNGGRTNGYMRDICMEKEAKAKIKNGANVDT